MHGATRGTAVILISEFVAILINRKLVVSFQLSCALHFQTAPAFTIIELIAYICFKSYLCSYFVKFLESVQDTIKYFFWYPKICCATVNYCLVIVVLRERIRTKKIKLAWWVDGVHCTCESVFSSLFASNSENVFNHPNFTFHNPALKKNVYPKKIILEKSIVQNVLISLM